MSQLSRILTAVDFSLTAVDFSEPARAAFDQALALSRAHRADLAVVHAVSANERSRWRAQARTALIAQLRHTAESSGVLFTVNVQPGDPAEVILQQARSRPPDLIVLGTDQRTGLNRRRTGSVAEQVAQQATQPVLIVPAGKTAGAGPPFDRIVVALDFGSSSNRAIKQALSLSSSSSRVTLVHVVRVSSSTDLSLDLSRYDGAECQNVLTRTAWRQLQDTIRHDATPASQIHARVATGDPATEITRIAAEIGADVIVLGDKRRDYLRQEGFSTTAARVLRVADRPVLTVPEVTSRVTSRADGRTQSLAA